MLQKVVKDENILRKMGVVHPNKEDCGKEYKLKLVKEKEVHACDFFGNEGLHATLVSMEEK